MVVRLGDQRYLLAAVVVHSLWGITWALISLPLISTWYNWQLIQFRAISEVMVGTSDVNKNVDIKNVDTKIKVLGDMKPIGFLNITASGVAALASFAWPVVQTLFK